MGLEWRDYESRHEGHRSAAAMGTGRRGRPRAIDPARPPGAPSDRAALHGGRARGAQSPGDGARQRGLRPSGRREGGRVARPRAFPRRVRPRDAPHPRRPRARAALSEAWRRRGEGHLRRGARRHRGAGQDFVALDDALEALAKFDERKSRVIEMRFFGGLSVEETAAVLKVSAETVMRDWRLAKVWLRREMRGA